MLKNSRRIDELKWIVPVDFVWTADLRWHYINWWKQENKELEMKMLLRKEVHDDIRPFISC